jgi:hypothetical protein
MVGFVDRNSAFDIAVGRRPLSMWGHHRRTQCSSHFIQRLPRRFRHQADDQVLEALHLFHHELRVSNETPVIPCLLECSSKHPSRSSLSYPPEVFVMTEILSLAQAHSTRRFRLYDAEDEDQESPRVLVSIFKESFFCLAIILSSSLNGSFGCSNQT